MEYLRDRIAPAGHFQQGPSLARDMFPEYRDSEFPRFKKLTPASG
jgi:hypothetical protein